MKVITHKDIMDLNISPKECYEVVLESFKAKDKCVLPAKASMIQSGHIFYNIMPSLNPEIQAGGVKVVTRYPSRIPSLDSQIYLYDMKDARLKAILDGNYITAMRTGAVAALAIETYGIENYKSIAIMGLGVTASAIMNVLTYTTRNRNIKIKLLRYKDQAEKFIEKYKGFKQFEFEICDTHKELIEESDVIISSVTFTDKNFAKFEWFKEGVLLLPVHVMGFGNVDYLFDKVHVDDPDHLHHMENYEKFKAFGQLSDVITGKIEGRVNEKERIVSYNIGLSIHDIAFANKVYDLMEDKKCAEINLYPPVDKYWL